MKVLYLAPNPADLPQFNPSRFSALPPCPDLTETGIKKAFRAGPYDVVHFVGHAQSRGANYATLAVLSADGRARWVTSGAVAAITELAGAKLWVLQACDEASSSFDPIAQAIAARGIAVLSAPASCGPSLATALQSATDLSTVAQTLSSTDPRIRLFGTLPEQVPAQVIIPPLAPAAVPQPTRPAWQDQIAAKRLTGTFDVFLCHHTADKPAVRQIGQRLMEQGILPWLDEWELQPGQPWQRLLEYQINGIRTAAVFVGAGGLGPWQLQEIDAFLRAFVKRNCPVIPVLLGDAPARPALPVFLEAMTWVDFRTGIPDPWARLVWGITGKRPFD